MALGRFLSSSNSQVVPSDSGGPSVTLNGKLRAGVVVQDTVTGGLLGCHPTGERAGFYDLPKGQVDGGEDLREAAARELLEETGISVSPGGLVSLGRYPLRNGEIELFYTALPVNLDSLHCNSLIDNPYTPERIGLPEMDGYVLIHRNDRRGYKWMGAIERLIRAAAPKFPRLRRGISSQIVLSKYNLVDTSEIESLVHKAVGIMKEMQSVSRHELPDVDCVSTLNDIFSCLGISFIYDPHVSDYLYPEAGISHGSLSNYGTIEITLGDQLTDVFFDSYNCSVFIKAVRSIFVHESAHAHQNSKYYVAGADPSDNGVGYLSDVREIDAQARGAGEEYLALGYTPAEVVNAIRDGDFSLFSESPSGWQYWKIFGEVAERGSKEERVWRRFLKRLVEYIQSVNSSYSVGRGHASGQYSVVDDNGEVVSYQDSLEDAEEYVRELNSDGLEPLRFPLSAIFKGYVQAREYGYRGSVEQWMREMGVAVAQSARNEAGASGRWEAEPINSATAKELLEANDNPNFYHRADHLKATKAVGDSEIVRAYANTLELRTKSEHFDKNETYYRQWVLFKDFYVIARDRKIKFEDAIDYSLNFGDVHIRCSCPSHTFHGFAYMGDQLQYLYGLPREKRFPKIRNPQLKNATCKHIHMALEEILGSKEKIIRMFSEYYKRLPEAPVDTMIAIPAPKAGGAVEAKQEVAEFEETGDVDVVLPEKPVKEPELEPEVISVEDPQSPGTVYVDTKLAEESLPEDQRVKYSGDDGAATGEEEESDGSLPAGREVSGEEVEALADEIDEAAVSPRSDDERFSTEWAWQGLRRFRVS